MNQKMLARPVAIAVLCLTASVASAQQYSLQKSNSYALGALFATGSGYGTNPLSVAFDGSSAYIGGFNSTAASATVGVVKIDNVLGGVSTPAGLVGSQFNASTARGIDALDFYRDSIGGGLFVAHDTNAAGFAPFVRRLNSDDGTTVWNVDSPTGARPQALAVDPLGNAGAPAVALITQGSGFVRRLNVADGTVVTPSGQFSVFTSPPGSSYRGLDFDSVGNLIYSEDSGVGVGIRDTSTGSFNRVVNVDNPAVNGPTIAINRTATLPLAIVNNVGTGASIVEGVTADGSKLIAFTNRVTGSGAGGAVTLTASTGDATTVESKRAQLRLLNGARTNGTLTLSQTELLGSEDGIGSAYAGEVKNFATTTDANGRPVLLVLDYITKQLDVYTIEPRYVVDADSTWSTPASWTLGIVPNGRTTNATFGNTITAARTVTLDGDKTVKQLKFDSPNAYTIAGTDTINLTAPANDNLNAYISVLNGSHTVNAPIVLGTNARFDVSNAADTLTINGVSGNGRVLAKRGLGSLSAANVRVNTLAVENGAVKVRADGTDAGMSRVGAVTLGTTGATPTNGTLDLTNNGLIVDYATTAATPFDAIYALVKADPTLGSAITSSLSDSSRTLGVIEYGSAVAPTFAGLAIDSTSVLIRFTLRGDTNLDKAVDFDDLLSLAQNYESGTGKLWASGDSNYDGVVNFDDLLVLAQNYGGSLLTDGSLLQNVSSDFAADFALARSLVPEPTSLAALATAGLVLRRRR